MHCTLCHCLPPKVFINTALLFQFLVLLRYTWVFLWFSSAPLLPYLSVLLTNPQKHKRSLCFSFSLTARKKLHLLFSSRDYVGMCTTKKKKKTDYAYMNQTTHQHAHEYMWWTHMHTHLSHTWLSGWFKTRQISSLQTVQQYSTKWRRLCSLIGS